MSTSSSSSSSVQDMRLGWVSGYGDRTLLAMRIFAVLLTAVSQPLLSAPFSWWPLHWIAWIPFLWAIFQQDGRGRIVLAWFGGTLANYLIFYWVTGMMPKFAGLPWAVAIVLNILLCMWLSVSWIVLAWWIPKLHKHYPRMWIFLAPALLVSIEFATPQLFPYMQGVSHYQVTTIFQIVSITGVYGMSFLVFWSNCIGFQMWQSYRRKEALDFRPLWLLVGVVLLVCTYGMIRQSGYTKALQKAKTIRVGLIQSNIKPTDRLSYYSTYSIYRKLSIQAVQKGAQWVIWSEGSFKYPFSWKSGRTFLTRLASDLKVPVLTGGMNIQTIRKKQYVSNSAVHVDPKSGFGAMHNKKLLVPFGEYMPLEKELHFIYKHVRWRSRYTRGTRMTVGHLQGVPYGFLICYEAIYPSLVRESVRNGARLLVNVTYDAWFGRTTAPYQHLMLAAIRSAELGVPLIRLATTGVTTTVDSLGRMGSLSSLYKRSILLRTVPLVSLPSMYARIGDLFAVLCVLILFISIVLARLGHWVETLKETPFV